MGVHSLLSLWDIERRLVAWGLEIGAMDMGVALGPEGFNWYAGSSKRSRYGQS